MKDVTVDKGQLLTKLKANRDEHRKIFEEALDGYHKRVVELLEINLEAVKQGKNINLHDLVLVTPQNQTKDYDRAIAMLEMSKDSEVTISEQDFRCFVMDEWAWMRNFLASNSMYSGTAVQKMSQQFDE